MLNDNIRLKNQIFNLILTEALKEDCTCELTALEEEIKKAEYTFSQKTEKFISAIIKRLKYSDSRSKIKKLLPKIGMVAASLIFCIAVFTNPKVNAFINDIIVKIFPNYNQYEFNSNNEITIDNFNYDIKPHYIPDGFRLTQCFYGLGTAELIYESEEESIIIMYGIADSIEFSIDNEHSEQIDITDNSKQFVLHKSEDISRPSNFIWTDSGYGFVITAQISEDEFVNIAKNIIIE